MDGRMSMYVLMVCVWCSLDAGGLLMVVTAQPTVSAEISTPEVDRKVGGRVDMRCVATNLQPKHIVEWTTETTDSRFSFRKEDVRTVINFTIMNVQREDSNDYVCRVIIRTAEGTDTIVTSSNVTLSVSFPNGSFPTRFPARPKTVDNGTHLLNCSIAGSVLEVSKSLSTTKRYRWTVKHDKETIIRTCDFIADVSGNDIITHFNCSIIIDFTDIKRYSCSTNVRLPDSATVTTPVMVPTTEPSTISTSGGTDSPKMTSPVLANDTTTLPPTDSRSLSTPLILALAFVLLVFAIAITLLLIFCVIRKNRLIKKRTAEKETNVAKADPYTKLQLTEDTNKGYMEPTVTTTTQDQAVKVKSDSSADGYLRPRPHDPKEQRRNHQVTVHVDPTPSPEATGPQHAYYRPVDLENERQEGSTSTGYEVVLTRPQHSERRYQNIYN